MDRRLSTLFAGALLAAYGASTRAHAEVSGSCAHEDRRVAFIDGLAWLESPDEDDEAEPGAPPPPPGPIRLGFATFALDADAVWRAQDREEALRDQGFGAEAGGRLELTVEEGLVTQQYLWISPGMSLSYGSNEVGRYRPGPEQAGRVRGGYRFTPEDGQDVDCTLTFDVALVGDVADAPPLPGVALPAGGGEPGAAYLALNRALHAGDIDAMLQLMPPERAETVRQMRGTPDFAAAIAFAQAISPTEVRITGGRQDGDRAWLDFTAREDGQPRVGVAEMRQEGGLWFMLRESTSDPE